MRSTYSFVPGITVKPDALVNSMRVCATAVTMLTFRVAWLPTGSRYCCTVRTDCRDWKRSLASSGTVPSTASTSRDLS